MELLGVCVCACACACVCVYSTDPVLIVDDLHQAAVLGLAGWR